VPIAGSKYIHGCAEQDYLVDLLDEGITHYVRVVADVVQRMGVMPAPAYTRAKASVEMAREHVEQARLALEKHREEHGCS
jgi:hypothetical protein